MKAFICPIAVLSFSLLSASCGSSSFSGQSNKTKQQSGNNPASPSSVSPGNGSLGKAKDATLDQEGKLLACPPSNQKILILDLLSGWWTQSYVETIAPAAQKCGGIVTVEYHHLLEEGSEGFSENLEVFLPAEQQARQGSHQLESAFREQDWNQYTQIWVLSGISREEGDLNVGGRNFQHLLAKARTSSANLFLGGYVDIEDHAIAFSNALNLGVTFRAMECENVGIAESAKTHPLLSHNVVDVSGINDLFQSDADCAADSAGLTPIVHDASTGGLSLGVKSLADGRRLVVDTHLFRYGNGGDTAQLLQNIMVWLSGKGS